VQSVVIDRALRRHQSPDQDVGHAPAMDRLARAGVLPTGTKSTRVTAAGYFLAFFNDAIWHSNPPTFGILYLQNFYVKSNLQIQISYFEPLID